MLAMCHTSTRRLHGSIRFSNSKRRRDNEQKFDAQKSAFYSGSRRTRNTGRNVGFQDVKRTTLDSDETRRTINSLKFLHPNLKPAPPIVELVPPPLSSSSEMEPAPAQTEIRQKSNFDYHKWFSIQERNSAVILNEWKRVDGQIDLGRFDGLSKQILAYYNQHKQTSDLFLRKMKLKNEFQKMLSGMGSDFSIFVTGSSQNGFGTRNSDMDLCLVHTDEGEHESFYHSVESNRWTALGILSELNMLLHTSNPNFFTKMNLVNAKTPLLKINFGPPYADIVADVNVSSCVSVQNTYLLYQYSITAGLMRPLVLVLKDWAKRNDVINAENKRFSSYAFELMVISFLQAYAKLPVLQELHERAFELKDFNLLDFNALERSNQIDSNQLMTLGNLFVAFFDYYGYRFNFKEQIVTVRTKGLLRRSDATQYISMYNKPTMWKCVGVEEPFTRSNAAYSVHDDAIFRDIRNTIRKTCRIIRETGDLASVLR